MAKRVHSLTAALALLLGLLACSPDSPEDQVRKAFETCRQAVEAGDAAAAAAPLDPAFQGPEGMDKATARLFLAATLQRERIGITVVKNDITIRGTEAFEDLALILTSRSGSLLPGEASQRNFQLRWRKVGSDWRLLEVQSPEGR
jgi:hypothetical protein